MGTVPIIYFLVGFPSEFSRFIQFYAVICLVASIAQVTAVVIGCAVGNAESAVQKLPPVIINFMLFAGLLIPKSKIPDWFIWIYWINPFNYAFKLLMYAGLEGQGDLIAGVRQGDYLLEMFSVKESDRLPSALV